MSDPAQPPSARPCAAPTDPLEATPTVLTPDHRARTDEELLEALGRGDALALAEACSRTLQAAVGVTSRLVPREDVEAVIAGVYGRLWRRTPDSGPLERWVRQTCWRRGTRLLRERALAPHAPSAADLLDDLPAPSAAYLDATERALADLPAEQRRALLRAHDTGVPSEGSEEGLAAGRALLRLADADTDQRIADHRAADAVLGLLPAAERATVVSALGGPDAEALRALRRGRRRLEGLPPGPDLAARLMAAVLVGPATEPAPAPRGTAATPSARATAQVQRTVSAARTDPPVDLAPGTPVARAAAAEPEGIRADPETARSARESTSTAPDVTGATPADADVDRTAPAETAPEAAPAAPAGAEEPAGRSRRSRGATRPAEAAGAAPVDRPTEAPWAADDLPPWADDAGPEHDEDWADVMRGGDVLRSSLDGPRHDPYASLRELDGGLRSSLDEGPRPDPYATLRELDAPAAGNEDAADDGWEPLFDRREHTAPTQDAEEDWEDRPARSGGALRLLLWAAGIALAVAGGMFIGQLLLDFGVLG